MKKLILVLSVAFLSTAAMAADGIKIISKTKNLANGAVSSTDIFMTDSNIVLNNKGNGDNSSFIFDATKQEFMYVDHSKREYYHFDRAAMAKLKQQIQMLMMMMKQFAANMPPEQKKKLDKILNKNESNVDFKYSGSQTKIGKWSAKKYVSTADGQKASDLYIASFSTLGYSKSQFQVMDKLIAYFKTNLSEIAAFLPSGGSFSQIGLDDSSPVFKEGVPVKTVSYTNGKAANENLVESISKTSINSDMFGAPSGYTKKELKMEMN